MDHALEPSPGDPSSLPGQQIVTPLSGGRLRRWSLRIGREGITWSSFSESYGPRGAASVATSRRFGMGPAIAAVGGGLALLMVGATAGRAWSPAPIRADAAMIVPDARPFVAAAPYAPKRTRRTTLVRKLAPVGVAPLAADDAGSVAASVALPGRAQAVERALRTGEFQEWADRDGATGFAVPGAAEVNGTDTCRPLAVLTRQLDGTDQVSNSKACSPTQD